MGDQVQVGSEGRQVGEYHTRLKGSIQHATRHDQWMCIEAGCVFASTTSNESIGEATVGEVFVAAGPMEEVSSCQMLQVKLVGILTKKCGIHQSGVEKELCFRHDASGSLICLMTIHVDDLKIAGEHRVVQELLKKLLVLV